MKYLVLICILFVAFLGDAKAAEPRSEQDVGKEYKAKPMSGLSDDSYRLLRDKENKVTAAEFYRKSHIRQLIESGKAEEEEFIPIRQLHKYMQLERLVIGYGAELITEDLASISKLPGIVKIEIGTPGIASEYVTILGDLMPLAQLKNLTVIRLCKDGIQDEDLRFVAKLPRLHTLEFRADNGQKNILKCTDKCAEYISQAKQLRHLNIVSGQFSDQFVESLVKRLPNLQTLQLNSEGLSDKALRSIAKHAKNLRELSIASSQFTKRGVKALDVLPKLKSVSIQSQNLRTK